MKIIKYAAPTTSPSYGIHLPGRPETGSTSHARQTDAAGAFAFTSTMSRAESAGLSAASALLKTGPTNTNVMDIRIVLLA